MNKLQAWSNALDIVGAHIPLDVSVRNEIEIPPVSEFTAGAVVK